MAMPDDYSDEIANIICERIAAGETLLDILKDEQMPARGAVHEWLKTNPGFSCKYEFAKEK